MTHDSPNIRMVTNILNVTGRLADTFSSRLSYWEYLEYSRRNPLEFPFRKDRLTAEQTDQRDAFIREGQSHLWPTLFGHRPMPRRWVENPFSAGPTSLEEPARTVSGTPEPRAKPRTMAEPRQSSPQRPVSSVDTEADSVITAADGIHQLVVAPPGTGKTHTVIQRASHLIRTGRVSSPAREILILTFSRAAVGEIIRRVASAVGDLDQDMRFVQASTFDSFATTMLLQDVGQTDIADMSYDDRIRYFTLMLGRGRLPNAQGFLSQVRHLIVDEVQDITGPRAEMVLVLEHTLVTFGATVLLLGDPAQAIYEFDLRSNDMTSQDLLNASRVLLNPVEREFHADHRFNDTMRPLVARLRDAIGSSGTEPDHAALTSGLASFGTPIPLAMLAAAIGTTTGTVAVLTRTNVEAYEISRWLSDSGVENTLNQGPAGESWPGWAARLLFGYHGDRMSKDWAGRRWATYLSNSDTQFDDAWTLLENHGVASGAGLDVTSLARDVRDRAPEPVRRLRPRVVVSTIHRSKGLEFDRVFLLEPQPNYAGDPEEARILYVAATRARTDLAVVSRDTPVLGRFRKKWKYTPEFAHFVKRKNDELTLYVEGLKDLDPSSLILLPNGGPDAARDHQDLIWRYCQSNVPVTIARRNKSTFALRLSFGDEPWLCDMSFPFAKDVNLICDRAKRWVDEFGGLEVSHLASVGLPPLVGSEKVLGTACLITVPVVHGLAHTQMLGGE